MSYHIFLPFDLICCIGSINLKIEKYDFIVRMLILASTTLIIFVQFIFYFFTLSHINSSTFYCIYYKNKMLNRTEDEYAERYETACALFLSFFLFLSVLPTRKREIHFLPFLDFARRSSDFFFFLCPPLSLYHPF